MARQVKVEILGDARGLRSAFREAERATGGFARGIARAGVFAATGIAGIVTGVGVVAAKSIAAAQESNKVNKQTAAVLKSTGGAARVTAKQISDLATAISNKTGIDDEQIQASENMLLTFTNVRNVVGKNNDIFTQATRIVQDMSVALGQDGTKSAIQLGKALNDPIRNLGALRRVGVQFNDQQVKQIKLLVESGRTLDAQRIILHELGKEFGGSAAAAATPLDKLRVTVGNLQETIGNLLLPIVNKLATWLTERVVPAVSRFARQLSERVFPAVEKFVTDHGPQFEAILKGVRDAFVKIQEVIQTGLIPQLAKLKESWDENKDALAILGGQLKLINPSVGFLNFLIKRWREEISGLAPILKNLTILLLGAELGILKLGQGFLWVVEHTLGLFNRGIRDSARHAREQIGGMVDRINRDLHRLTDKHISVTVQGTIHWDKNAALLKQLTGNFTHKLPAFAHGGRLPGYGGGDRHLILAEGGEAVVPKEAAREPGFAAWAASRGIRGFQQGGLVGRRPQFGPLVGATGDAERYATRAALNAMRALHVGDLRGFAAGFTGGAASGNVIRLALAQAKRMGASFKVALALIEAGIVESGLRNLAYGDRDSLGFLQQRPSQGWLHPMNISYAAWDFLRRAIPIAGNYGTAGQLAQAVQRSAFPARYDAVQARALGILHAYGYDRGGALPPGLSLAYNGTGRPEPVGGRTVLEIRSGGSRLDDVLVEVLRKAVRARGGNVQAALGT